jgi:cytochrome c556
LKAIRDAGFKPSANHPDVDPAHEALQLAEHFREVLRLPEARMRGQNFMRTTEAFERVASALESSLRQLGQGPKAGAHDKAEAAFTAVGQGCATCHARYRDN